MLRRHTEAFRSYYQVPYAEREAAKALGARWDAAEKLWYATSFEVSDAMAERWKPVYRPDPRAAGALRRQEARKKWRVSRYI